MKKPISKELYMNPVGRDQWITLRKGGKIIVLTDIQSGFNEVIPFLTKKAAKENYDEWLKMQDIRLPKSFLINTEIVSYPLLNAINNANLPWPDAKDLKKHIFYHKSMDQYSFITLDDDFSNPRIPVLDLQYIVDVNDFNSSPKKKQKLFGFIPWEPLSLRSKEKPN